MKNAVIEMVKEAARIALFAALTALVGWASSKLAGLDPNSIYYIAGTVFLRLVDKFIHENENTELKGLAPF